MLQNEASRSQAEKIVTRIIRRLKGFGLHLEEEIKVGLQLGC
jgi:hypothetical protein